MIDGKIYLAMHPAVATAGAKIHQSCSGGKVFDGDGAGAAQIRGTLVVVRSLEFPSANMAACWSATSDHQPSAWSETQYNSSKHAAGNPIRQLTTMTEGQHRLLMQNIKNPAAAQTAASAAGCVAVGCEGTITVWQLKIVGSQTKDFIIPAHGRNGVALGSLPRLHTSAGWPDRPETETGQRQRSRIRSGGIVDVDPSHEFGGNRWQAVCRDCPPGNKLQARYMDKDGRVAMCTGCAKISTKAMGRDADLVDGEGGLFEANHGHVGAVVSVRPRVALVVESILAGVGVLAVVVHDHVSSTNKMCQACKLHEANYSLPSEGARWCCDCGPCFGAVLTDALKCRHGRRREEETRDDGGGV